MYRLQRPSVDFYQRDRSCVWKYVNPRRPNGPLTSQWLSVSEESGRLWHCAGPKIDSVGSPRVHELASFASFSREFDAIIVAETFGSLLRPVSRCFELLRTAILLENYCSHVITHNTFLSFPYLHLPSLLRFSSFRYRISEKPLFPINRFACNVHEYACPLCISQCCQCVFIESLKTIDWNTRKH